MSNWERREFNLPENHGWTAKSGNRIFVANQGAVRFEVPDTWILELPKGSKSFQFFDGKPPHDDIRLDLRIMYLAATHPEIDWSQVRPWNQPPIADWLKKNIANDRRQPTKVGPPLTITLGDLTTAWAEIDFIDPPDQRPAHSRICYALKPAAALLAIITMDYWADDAHRARPVWGDVLGTLKLGEYIASPFHGPDR